MTTMNLEMVLTHITEYVAANKWRPLAKLKTKMIDVDIIGECWLRAMTANTVDARQVRSFYDNFTCDEAQARQRIVWLVRAYVKNELQKLTIRKELEMKNPEAILENTMSQNTARQEVDKMEDMFFNLSVTEDEKVLLLWKLDVITEEAAIESLDISRRTLYSRYKTLVSKLQACPYLTDVRKKNNELLIKSIAKIPSAPGYGADRQGNIYSLRFDRIKKLKPHKNKSLGYLQLQISPFGKAITQFVHRLVAEAFLPDWDPELQVDHINNDKDKRDDNRIENLRMATRSQNLHNISSAKGYHWNKINKNWVARITIKGEHKHIGCFSTEEEAHKAYMQAKEKYLGFHPTDTDI